MDEKEKIKKNPHVYIKNWMEQNLIHVGNQIMDILALQPCSLVLPDIPYGSTGIRSSFNILYIAPPSSGKSTIARKFSEITFRPYKIKTVTEAKLQQDLDDMKIFSLILEDIADLSGNYDLIKVVEGAIGDERNVNRRTKTYTIDSEGKLRGTGLLEGTWNDLNHYIEKFSSGTLFRCVFIFLSLTEQQKEEIAKNMNNGIGSNEKSEKTLIMEEVVKDYYNELYELQNDEKKQIKGYMITEEMKGKIYLEWKKSIVENTISSEYQFNRELHEGYRFLISSAFLNVFNRKVENNILYPNEEDLNLAIRLMKLNLENKMGLLKGLILFNSQSGSISASYIKKLRTSDNVKNILTNLYPNRIIKDN